MHVCLLFPAEEWLVWEMKGWLRVAQLGSLMGEGVEHFFFLVCILMVVSVYPQI